MFAGIWRLLQDSDCVVGFNDYTDDELMEELKNRGYVVVPTSVWEELKSELESWRDSEGTEFARHDMN
jgi:hypothetical protein